MLILPTAGFGQYTAERTTTENIDIETGAEFKVENKYGDITIIGWDQPSISIVTKITVRKKDKSEAEELLDRISPKISNFGRYVSLKTEIEEKSTGFFGRLLAEVIEIDLELSKSDIEIDLEINLPSTTELEIVNSFGDVVISDWSASVRSDIRHGDLRITEPIERATIDHSFGKLNFLSINNASINLKSGRLKADSINDLRLESHGSELEIKEVGFLNLISNKDEIRIGKVSRIKGELRFGNVFLDVVQEEIYLDLWVTDLRVSKLKNTAPNVFVQQQNSEVDINIAGTAFDMYVEMEGGIFRIPESMAGVESKVMDEKSNYRKVSARYGAVKNGKITLEGKKGFVILREL